MRADLHVHSNASDGTDTPAEVMHRAARAGLDAVALTDHDTVAGHAEARRSLPDGLTLVPGMELSCRLDSVDPGADFASAPPIAVASFGKHDFPLWQVGSPDRAVVAGEIKGHWLWVVLWPETAGILLIEPIGLRDLRDPGLDLDLPFGAPSPRLPI